MYVHDRTAGVVMEKVLAPGAGLTQHPAVHGGRRTGEPALRAGHGDRRAAESALVQPGQPVQCVPFGQRSP